MSKKRAGRQAGKKVQTQRMSKAEILHRQQFTMRKLWATGRDQNIAQSQVLGATKALKDHIKRLKEGTMDDPCYMQLIRATSVSFHLVAIMSRGEGGEILREEALPALNEASDILMVLGKRSVERKVFVANGNEINVLETAVSVISQLLEMATEAEYLRASQLSAADMRESYGRAEREAEPGDGSLAGVAKLEAMVPDIISVPSPLKRK